MIGSWKTKIGVVREDSYGVDKLVTRQIPFLIDSVGITKNLIRILGADALGSHKRAKLTGLRYTGSVGFILNHYTSEEESSLLLAIALGQTISGTGYRYLYPSGDQPESFNLCLDEDGTIYTHLGGKVLDLNISGSPSGPLTADASVIFQDRTDSSSINTSSSGWTLSEGELILFEDVVFWINDYSAGALSSSDEVIISSLNVKITGDYIINQTKSSGLNISEPRRKKWDLSASFGVTELGSLLADSENRTLKKALLRATKVSGGKTYTFTIWFPKCEVVAFPGEIGTGTIEPSIRLELFKPGTVPTGFPNYDAGIIIEIRET